MGPPEKSFSMDPRLARSMVVPETGKTIFRCKDCTVVCSNKSGFVRHKCNNRKKTTVEKIVTAAVNNEDIFQCDQCTKVFSSNSSLKRHKTMLHKPATAPDDPTPSGKRMTRSQRK